MALLPFNSRVAGLILILVPVWISLHVSWFLVSSYFSNMHVGSLVILNSALWWMVPCNGLELQLLGATMTMAIIMAMTIIKWIKIKHNSNSGFTDNMTDWLAHIICFFLPFAKPGATHRSDCYSSICWYFINSYLKYENFTTYYRKRWALPLTLTLLLDCFTTKLLPALHPQRKSDCLQENAHPQTHQKQSKLHCVHLSPPQWTMDLWETR